MKTRALLGAGATVTAATVVANLFSYLLIAAGTRVLGPDRYAELAALLGLLLVGAVPATTVQVVLARRVAVGQTGGLGQATVRAAVAVTVVAAAVLPVLHLVLRISVPALVFFTLTLPALTLTGATTGAVQGLHQFGRLASITAIAGSGRVIGGLAGLAIGRTAVAAMAGLAAGTWLAALATVTVARGPARSALLTRGRPATREIAHASATMLALAAIMTVDVLLAKRYLPASEAGLYGAANLVTKVALWAPYAVTMIALPRLAVDGHRRAALRVSIAVLTGIGVLEVAGVLLLGSVIFPLAVGAEYRAVTGWLWLFAVEGAVLAITQLVVMSRVAATDRMVPLLLWAGLIAEVLIVSGAHGSIGTILTIATITAAAVAAAGLSLGSRSP